jgi:O-antigen ligase
MWRSHPLTGVGFGQFGEYHYLTAHNSYLLTLAELGFLGMVLFSSILYVSLKIPLAILSRIKHAAPGSGPGPVAVAVLKPWAMALIAAFGGLMVGIFFLSFAYHYVLWIYVGLAGALYSAVRRHDPDFNVRFGWRDLGIVAAVDLAVVVFVFFYTRWALA